ncbi:DUF6630 family protein [Flavobacterium johnsoniae]|uniref:DUF6630 family protein n=1 Tax=Flavobacterium johnsoniae TaxID=986 RepID=UPI003D984579
MMKKIFSNLFGRNQESRSIICFEILQRICDRLRKGSDLKINIKGINDSVLVNFCEVPYSFCDEKRDEEINNAGFNNSYEVLNEVYKSAGIRVLDDKEIRKGLLYEFMHIIFYSKTSQVMGEDFEYTKNSFIIFLCSSGNSTEDNDFRMLYSNDSFIDYVQGLLDCRQLDIDNPKNETEEIGIKNFKLVLQAACQYLNIEIPKDIELPSQENLIEAGTGTTLENLIEEDTEAVLENFEEFISLVSRGDIEEKELKKWSKKLLKNYKNGSNEYPVILDETYFDFFRSLNTWYSDWKFDPEDAESSISEMIDEDLNFEYPEETFSHDLFPYINTALNKHNYEMMSFNIYGDGYLFFVANKKDVSRILELSEITQIAIDQLQF